MWRVILGVLLAALLFSSYMVFYTSELKGRSFSLSVIFPKADYTARGNLDSLLVIVGDRVSSFRGVVDRGGCRVFSYLTEKMGRAEVAYCSSDAMADVTVYVNYEGLPFGRAGINGMDVAQEIILHLAYMEEKAKTGFVIYYSEDEELENLTYVRVRQSINGLPILGSGFELVVDEESKTIHKLTAYRIYGVEEHATLPKPRYEKLYNTLSYINIPSEKLNIQGLLACGEDITYVITVAGLALALINANTGSLLGLYVFDEEGGREVISPRECRVDWLGLPENRYKPIPA